MNKIDLRAVSPLDIIKDENGDPSCVIGYFASFIENDERVDIWSFTHSCLVADCKSAYPIPVKEAHRYVSVLVEYQDEDMETTVDVAYDDRKERKDMEATGYAISGYTIGSVSFDEDWKPRGIIGKHDWLNEGDIEEDLSVRLGYLHNVQQLTRALGGGELQVKNLRDPRSELFGRWLAETVERRNVN